MANTSRNQSEPTGEASPAFPAGDLDAILADGAAAVAELLADIEQGRADTDKLLSEMTERDRAALDELLREALPGEAWLTAALEESARESEALLLEVASWQEEREAWLTGILEESAGESAALFAELFPEGEPPAS